MMNDLNAINAFIPKLRRHARMLVGHREVADRLLLQIIGKSLVGIDAASSGTQITLTLFRAFARLVAGTNWAAFISAPRIEQPNAGAPIPGLLSLPIFRRQVLLLADVEKFELADVAYILEITEESASWHLAESRAALAAAKPARVMIIEDDPIISMDLAFMVEEAGHEVVAIASRENEAVERAATAKADIILSDVQLKDGGNGLDAVRRITGSFAVPVIFITAFPERLMTGDPLEPAFVISKPYDIDTVRTALLQTLSLMRGEADAIIDVAA